MSIKEEIRNKLEKYPHVKYQEGESSITIFPVDEEGFIVDVEETSTSYIVSFEGWHETFQNEDEALNCIAFGLSDSCRLKVVLRGGMPQKWAVESKDNGEWVQDSETGLLLFPFWRKERVVYKQNYLINET